MNLLNKCSHKIYFDYIKYIFNKGVIKISRKSVNKYLSKIINMHAAQAFQISNRKPEHRETYNHGYELIIQFEPESTVIAH